MARRASSSSPPPPGWSCWWTSPSAKGPGCGPPGRRRGRGVRPSGATGRAHLHHLSRRRRAALLPGPQPGPAERVLRQGGDPDSPTCRRANGCWPSCGPWRRTAPCRRRASASRAWNSARRSASPSSSASTARMPTRARRGGGRAGRAPRHPRHPRHPTRLGRARAGLRIALDRKAGPARPVAYAVGQSLQVLLSGATATQLREGNRLVDVVVRAPAAERLGLSALGDLTIATPAGAVPLSQLARLEPVMEEPILWRRNRELYLTVRADMAEGLQGPDVTAAASRASRRCAPACPPTSASSPAARSRRAPRPTPPLRACSRSWSAPCCCC